MRYRDVQKDVFEALEAGAPAYQISEILRRAAPVLTNLERRDLQREILTWRKNKKSRPARASFRQDQVKELKRRNQQLRAELDRHVAYAKAAHRELMSVRLGYTKPLEVKTKTPIQVRIQGDWLEDHE